MSPPFSSALLRAIESPSPMPRFLKEIVGWNRLERACSLSPGPESCTSMATRAAVGRGHAENPAALARGLGRILQQVGQDALEQVLVGHHRRRASSARRQS